MHAHNYPIDQVKEVALTTIEALNRVESTASDADFNDGNFARLDDLVGEPRPARGQFQKAANGYAVRSRQGGDGRVGVADRRHVLGGIVTGSDVEDCAIGQRNNAGDQPLPGHVVEQTLVRRGQHRDEESNNRTHQVFHFITFHQTKKNHRKVAGLVLPEGSGTTLNPEAEILTGAAQPGFFVDFGDRLGKHRRLQSRG